MYRKNRQRSWYYIDAAQLIGHQNLYLCSNRGAESKPIAGQAKLWQTVLAWVQF